MTLLSYWVGAWLPGFIAGFAVAEALRHRAERIAIEREIRKREAQS